MLVYYVVGQWGQEQRRQDEGYWIKRWVERREAIAGSVVCTDVRYLNEALFALGEGGLLVRVWVPEPVRIARVTARDGRFDPAWGQHSSEQHIPTLPVHAEVSGSMGEGDIPLTLEAIYQEMQRWREAA